MTEWKDIASAPRDGTLVDLWCHGQFSAGRVTECWHSGGKWWHYAEGEDDEDGNCRAQVHNATQWMPIPGPPRPAQSPAGAVTEDRLLRIVIDETWGDALEDGSVPATKKQDEIIARSRAALTAALGAEAGGVG